MSKVAWLVYKVEHVSWWLKGNMPDCKLPVVISQPRWGLWRSWKAVKCLNKFL